MKPFDLSRESSNQAYDRRPATYGGVMKPLDIEALPDDLLVIYKASPLLREWIRLHEVVRRAEKISSWTEWTEEQTAGYGRDDYVAFSRLRGYTEQEIADFQRFVALTEEVDREQGDAGFCMSVSWAIKQLVSTERLVQIEAHLLNLSKLHMGSARNLAGALVDMNHQTHELSKPE